MTPFGLRMRQLRAKHGMTLKDMAAAIGVSPAYLSALEHGRRGTPTPARIHQICQLFNIIWDDAEEIKRLAETSHPKVTIDTSGLSAEATELVNLLAKNLKHLDREEPEKVRAMLGVLGR